MDLPTHPPATLPNQPQQEEDIKGVKKMVGKGCPGGVRREGITLEGFWEVVRLFLFNMQVCCGVRARVCVVCLFFNKVEVTGHTL